LCHLASQNNEVSLHLVWDRQTQVAIGLSYYFADLRKLNFFFMKTALNDKIRALI